MTDVGKFYRDVIEDVIGGVKDELIEDGLDMQVLEELKKLWIAKLDETHVCDAEPVLNTAAQYLNLVQRSQLGTRVLISTQPPNNTMAATDPLMRPVGIPGGLGDVRTAIARPAAVPMEHGLTRVQLHPQPVMTLQQQHPQQHPQQQQRLPQQTLVATAPGMVTANAITGGHVQPQLQTHRGVIATGLQPGAAPQLAALPSGLTGHLVQIGQQTYLVPQLLNVRQPGAPQLTISQLVGGPPGQAIVTTGGEPKAYTLSSDGSIFQQTQVDGGHDSDDDGDKFCDTPSSHQQTPGPSVHVRSVLPQSVQPSDLDDDDDDDDDDLVPATPGFTPSSVRSNQHYQTHRPGGLGSVTPMDGSDALHRNQLNGVTPLISGPPTPMTPQSNISRTPADGSTPGWRRLKPANTNAAQPVASVGSESGPGTLSRKRRHRSPYGPGDTDTELDDDYEECEDVGEDVELMTNATMTPAGQGPELEDEDDDGGNAERANKARVRHSGSVGTARPKASRTQQSSSAAPDSVPDPVPPPVDTGPDSDLPRDAGADEEEEEQEEDEEPLNSEDDVSDEEPEVLFESDNVVVCQYDKIHRSRNRWRLSLKDGVMAINGRDHVFQKAMGEAEW